jgi:drug/metabolite transporter (DMT)-like permease
LLKLPSTFRPPAPLGRSTVEVPGLLFGFSPSVKAAEKRVKFIREMGGGTPMFVDPALPPALASAALGGVSAILLRKATGGADAFAVNFVKLAAGSASLAVAALALGFEPPSTAVAIRMAYVGLTGPLLGWYLYIKALSLGGVSVASTIANTYPLVAVAVAYLLGSAPKANHVAGALLVVAGVRLLLSGSNGEDRRRAALLAGATSALWGVNQVVAKAAAGESDPMTLSLLRVLFAAIPAAPLALARGLGLSRGALAGSCRCGSRFGLPRRAALAALAEGRQPGCGRDGQRHDPRVRRAALVDAPRGGDEPEALARGGRCDGRRSGGLVRGVTRALRARRESRKRRALGPGRLGGLPMLEVEDPNFTSPLSAHISKLHRAQPDDRILRRVLGAHCFFLG